MTLKNDRIGFIIYNVSAAWDQCIWPSYAKSAVSFKKSLYIFPGGRLHSRFSADSLRNSIYSLVNPENLDGVICWSPTLKNEGLTKEDFFKFHNGLEPLPYVTISDKFQGHPCIDVDCYTGTKQLVKHCIEEHGAKKIAFLRGPVSHLHSLDRLKGYEDALKEAGLPVSRGSPLVTYPVGWIDGDKAAAQLFEQRKLKPGVDFDTLVGADDGIVIKAVNYFKERGFIVPRDYHAVGFDNSLECLLCESRLSTVMMPYLKMSSESFRVLLNHMNDKDESGYGQVEDVFLPSMPVLRESCGCSPVYYRDVDPEYSMASKKTREEILLEKITGYLELSEGEMMNTIVPLIRIWYKISDREFSGTDGAPSDASDDETSDINFFNYFEKAIGGFFDTEREPDLLFRLLNDIYNAGIVSASQFRKFEPAMLRIIYKVREQAVLNRQYRSDHLKEVLDSLKFTLIDTKNRNSLMECLAEHLPKIGIGTAGLALYGEGGKSQWVGSFSPNGISSMKEKSFSSKQLVPDSQKKIFSNNVFLIQPLFFEDRSLGYFIHNVPSYDGAIYEDIRNTVSYTLKSILQFEEVLRAQEKVLESIEQSRILTLQKEAAQAASEAQGQFLANVSHEIRTPMNAILGMSELMLSEELNARHRQHMEDIKTSAMALLEIINQILDISKIQSGEMNLVPVHYDFKSMLDNICSIMPFLIKTERVGFKMNIHGDIPQYLYGDNVRLRQILINLLGNAVKFTKVGFVHLSLDVADTNIQFTVRDSGIGIRREDLPNLFDAFKQFDVKKNRDKSGTGLGLTISKALVDMMNGKINVESVYGRGTTIRVIIPIILGDKSKVRHAGLGEKLVCPPGTKILVVDDNETNLVVIEGLLRLSGVTVSTTMSGSQAIEMVQQNKYTLIFMDHMMPEMDGVETLKIIRKLGINTPVIALTANAVKSAKDMLLAVGMNGFLSKPIVIEELNEILFNWVSGSKYITSHAMEAPVDHDTSGTASHSSLGDKAAFWEKVNNISCISMQVGLERASGQMDVYENILKSLIREIDKCTANLNNFIAKTDMHNFTIEAHSMKSSLANVGAMELSTSTFELESASLRGDSDYCTLHLQPFLDELLGLKNILTEYFSELNQDDKPVIVPPDFADVLLKMSGFLKENKYEDINNELRDLDALNPVGSIKNHIEDIKDAIIIMDYDSALEKIKSLLT